MRTTEDPGARKTLGRGSPASKGPGPTVPRRAWVWPTIPIVLAVGFHANTIPGDFVYDDEVLLEQGTALQEFDLHRIFLTNYWGPERTDKNWRPLLLFVHALNFRLGTEAWSFHVLNVILHAAACYLAWRVLLALLGDPAAATAGAGVFAVLSIHTEAVANIVGRAEPLAAMAIFGAWAVALPRTDPGTRSAPESWKRAIAAGGITLLGLLAKENAAVVPGVILVGAIALRRPLPWKAISSSAAAVVVYLGARAFALAGKESVSALIENPLQFVDPLVRILNAIRLLAVYAWKTVVPVHLSADYGYDQVPVLGLDEPLLWLGVLGSLALGILPWVLFRRRAPVLALAPIIFLVTILPVANIVFPVGGIFAERWAYTPSIAWALALAGLFAWNRAPRTRAVWTTIIAVLIAAYGARTWVRNADWASAARAYERMPLDSPRSARAHLKAAETLVSRARRNATDPDRKKLLAEARRSVARSLEIYPEHGRAQAKLAEILMIEGKYSEAVEQFTRAGKLLSAQHQGEPKILRLRAECLLQLGRPREAFADADAYVKVLSALGAPPDGVAHNFRGLALALEGRFEDAMPDFDRALELRRDLPEIWNNRGMCSLQRGATDAAIRDWKEALRLLRERAERERAEGREAAARATEAEAAQFEAKVREASKSASGN